MSSHLKKILVVVLGLSIIIGIGTVSAQEAKKKIVLRALISDGHQPYFRKMEEVYEAKHPNVDLEIQVDAYKYSLVLKQIRLATVAKTKYDLVTVDDIWVGEIGASGYLSPKYSDSYQRWADEHGLYDIFKRGSRYKGTYYGIWYQTDTRGIWVWKDVLHKAGYTMEDIMTNEGLLKALPKITKVAKEEFGMAGGLEYPFNSKWVVDQWYGWLYGLGGSILKQVDGKWKAGFDNQAGYQSIQFVKDLKEAGASFTKSWRWHCTDMRARKYAMVYEGNWCWPDFRKDFPDLTIDQIKEKLGFIPTTRWEGKKLRVLTGGWFMSVPKYARHPDIAHEAFMLLLNNREAYAEALNAAGHQPTSEWMWESPTFKKAFLKTWPETWAERIKEGIAGGVWRPFFPEYPEIQERLWEATQKVVTGKATPEEAMGTAASKVNELMKE